MSANVTRVDTSLIDPEFLADVLALLNADPGEWVITTGWRDPAVEAAGYAAWQADHSKPKFTNPDNSAHCCTPALAVDVTLVKGDTDDWDYTDADWQRMVNAVIASPHLHSLGPSIGDWDHIERVNWRAFRVPT